MRISAEEFAARREALAAQLAERDLSGCVLFDLHYVAYYTGFAFIPTERPIAFALAVDGRGGMLVPRLEVEHAQANAAVSEVAHYDEYPGERRPMEALIELLGALGIRGRLGADHDRLTRTGERPSKSTSGAVYHGSTATPRHATARCRASGVCTLARE